MKCEFRTNCGYYDKNSPTCIGKGFTNKKKGIFGRIEGHDHSFCGIYKELKWGKINK